MFLFTVAVFALCLGVTHASYSQLDWSDCGSDPRVSITKIDVSPMPIVLPGPIHLTLQVKADLSISDIQIHMDVKRHTFLLDLPIPCLFHVGSCTYENSCPGLPLLDTMVAEDWAGIMAGLGGQIRTMLTTVPGLNTTACPVPPATINIQQYTLNLPPVPSILSFFAEGDYKAHVTATDKSTGQQLICLKLALTIKEKEEPCTGIFCG
ncbi:ganglioside GM2 activator-like [Littorina saxatilis]|uniref:MD-2-related lipid-recognition domain-containing protein n=1 Tax=Littorina saxatilis TaxID=31220 RepID=A0AAN9GJX1_9CAEN